MVVFNELERLWPSGVENMLPVPVTRQAVDRVRIRALSGRETPPAEKWLWQLSMATQS